MDVGVCRRLVVAVGCREGGGDELSRLLETCVEIGFRDWRKGIERVESAGCVVTEGGAFAQRVGCRSLVV